MKCGNTECDGYDEDSLYNCDASDFFPETQTCCDFQPLISKKADGSKVPCSDGLCRIKAIANNALYFDDNSDYATALWQILEITSPEIFVDGECHDLSYIEKA